MVFPAVEEVAAADPARYRSTENRIHHPQFYHKWISMDRINHGIINHHMAGLFLRMRMRSLPRIRLSQPVSICHIDGLLLLTSAHIQIPSEFPWSERSGASVIAAERSDSTEQEGSSTGQL